MRVIRFLLLVFVISQASGLFAKDCDVCVVVGPALPPYVGATTYPSETPAVVTSDSLPSPLADTVTISEIVLRGNKRTRRRVIFREMSFGKGARIPADQLAQELAQTYNNLMNTGLFASMEITVPDSWATPETVIVLIDMRETWYIYPAPTFSLADRNFNVWWRDQNRSLDRINIGGNLNWYNFTGWRDRLKLVYTTGYTQRYQAGYRLPYLDKAGKVGIDLNYGFRRQREQNFQTKNNQQAFYRDENNFVYQSASTRAVLTYRRKLYVSHSLRIGYRSDRIADTIAEVLNPAFFGDGMNAQRYLTLGYGFRLDTRDVRNYPWKGTFLDLSLVKDGLGITGVRNGFTFGMNASRFFPLSDKLSLNVGVGAKYSLVRSQQPFLENRAIGFGGNSMVGYQFYVVDGLDMAIWRFGVRQQLFDFDVDLGKLVFIDAFRYVPVRLLLAFQFNQGYANAPFAGLGNELNNTLLTGASFGLDVVLFYDMVASAGYYRNHLGEGGTLISFNLSF